MKKIYNLYKSMLIGTDVCVCVVFLCLRKLTYPEEMNHLSGLVTTWPSHNMPAQRWEAAIVLIIKWYSYFINITKKTVELQLQE